MLQIERLERQTYSEQQMAAAFLAAGATDVTIPTFDQARELFDEALAAEPVPESPHLQLLQDLGVA